MVDMIDLIGPMPCLHHPDNPMYKMFSAANEDGQIPFVMWVTCRISDILVLGGEFICKQPSCLVVVQHLKQSCLGEDREFGDFVRAIRAKVS